ncbi:MAG: hypothetical protein B7Y96_09755, partial [Comamonadaceae bacterium 32-67-11]
MSPTVYVPNDSVALALGADALAAALQLHALRRGSPLRLVRNSSRGLYSHEPLLEVDTPAGRVGYARVSAEQVPALFDADFLHGGAHPSCIGLVERLDWLQRQERLTFARAGLTDPLCLDDYARHGGWAGLLRALELGPAATVEEIAQSGLRGRGGAAFPAGIKWRTVAAQTAAPKYVVCNADEGDSGTYADRMAIEGDPYQLIEGMAIAAYAVGASSGYVYLRSEYPHAIATFKQALERARAAGWLGARVAGSSFAFDIELRVGAGAYICGEESSLLESLEGKRGLVRARPPLPAVRGLFGQPTLVHNVISLATVPVIVARGAAFYANYGAGRSRGTLPIQLAGNLRTPGLVEKAFGVSLRELIEDFGGGTASGRPVKAVQIGGPLGAYLSAAELDLPLDYETLAQHQAMVGHGGIVVFDDRADMAALARYAMHFTAIESCGKCTPCRIGAVRGR